MNWGRFLESDAAVLPMWRRALIITSLTSGCHLKETRSLRRLLVISMSP